MWPFIPNIQKLLEKRNVTGILAALAYKHPVVREAAARALGEVGDSRATEGLCSALKDSHSKVRQAAANAIGADWRNASRPSSLCGFERARRRSCAGAAAKVLAKIGPSAAGVLWQP